MTATPSEAFTERPGLDDSRGRHRHRRPRRARRRLLVGALTGVTGLALLGGGYAVLNQHKGAAAAEAVQKGAKAQGPGRAANAAPAGAHPTPTPDGTLPAIAGLGPKTIAAIPAGTRQVLVASGKAKNSSDTLVTLWSKTEGDRWRPGAAWPAHNALDGWTTDHHSGDLHSPIGVFTLSDAGGFDSDPGSRLPYHRSSKFQAGGVGFNGETLDQAFDYVIAVNYNRVPGTSPLDGSQPLGANRGGGIWVHVDHGGPTHGCVSISAAHMVDLLHTLLPTAHPVIVMGDRTSLAT